VKPIRTFSLIVAVQMKFFELMFTHMNQMMPELRKRAKKLSTPGSLFPPDKLLDGIYTCFLSVLGVEGGSAPLIHHSHSHGFFFESMVGYDEMAMNCCPQFLLQSIKELETPPPHDGADSDDSDTIYKKAPSPKKIRKVKGTTSRSSTNSNFEKKSEKPTKKISGKASSAQNSKKMKISQNPSKNLPAGNSLSAVKHQPSIPVNKVGDDRKPPPTEGNTDFSNAELLLPAFEQPDDLFPKSDSPLDNSFRPTEFFNDNRFVQPVAYVNENEQSELKAMILQQDKKISELSQKMTELTEAVTSGIIRSHPV